MGHSAGAHIAALLTLDERYLKNVGLDRSFIRGTAALSGPYDFIPMTSDLAVFGMASKQSPVNPDMEPINFADGHAPPMLLVQGRKDQVVDPANADRLAAKLRQAGGDVTTLFYPDRGHPSVVMAFAWEFRWLAPVLHDVTEFFNNH
jgi:acetyl esterase/lipase